MMRYSDAVLVVGLIEQWMDARDTRLFEMRKSTPSERALKEVEDEIVGLKVEISKIISGLD